MTTTVKRPSRAETSIPPLSPQDEVALLARTLWREGYDDHVAGHITYRQPDGTLLCTPWPLMWNEIRSSDVIRIDTEANLLEGDWEVPPGIQLHVQLHKLRPNITVALHNHSHYGTVWSAAGRVPGYYNQSSVLGGGRLVLVDEYDGPVNNPDSARRAVEKMGDAEMALLSHHGVFVLAPSIRMAHLRAVALEFRCRTAWEVEALGSPVPMRAEVTERFLTRSNERGFPGYWEALVRQELRADPLVIGG